MNKSASELIKYQNFEQELRCAHEYLNNLDVPQTKNNNQLSLVGRIIAYQRMTHDDAYTVK